MEHDWLKRVTIESRWPITAAPFAFTLDGEMHQGATDGRIAVLVKGEAKGMPDGNESPIGERLAKWFSQREGGIELPLDELREWAMVKTRMCCPFCKGSGSRLDTPTDYDEFYESDYAAPVKLRGVVVNRNALALPLHFAEAASGNVTVYVADDVEVKDGMEGGAVRVDADNLKFILMGMNTLKVTDGEIVGSFPKGE